MLKQARRAGGGALTSAQRIEADDSDRASKSWTPNLESDALLLSGYNGFSSELCSSLKSMRAKHKFLSQIPSQ